jgi:predicted PurR-regulated permease PerM
MITRMVSENPRLASPSVATATPPAQEFSVQVRHLVSIAGWSVCFLFFFFFLGAFKLVLLGFLAALCLSALLRPLLHRLPGPRALKGFVLALLPLAVCGGLVFVAIWLLVKPIRSELAYWPQTEARFDAWLAGVSSHVGMGASHPLSVRGLAEVAGRWLTGSGLLHGIGASMIDLAIGIVFVFIGAIYMLAEPAEESIPILLKLLPPRQQLRAQAAIDKLEPRLRWWLIGALITAAIIGLTSLLGFWLIGLKFFIPLAILAGVSEFVPTIGPALAFLVALAFAAAQGADTVIWLVSLYVLVHILESYILIPVVYKEAVRVPPVVTLFTVVLWGEIFGIGGLLLAVPINLFLWTLAENFIGYKDPLLTPQPTTLPIKTEADLSSTSRR